MSDKTSQIANRDWVAPAVALVMLNPIDPEVELHLLGASDTGLPASGREELGYPRHMILATGGPAEIPSARQDEHIVMDSNQVPTRSRELPNKTPSDDWVEIAESEDEWRSRLTERIIYLSTKQDGWKGHGSRGPSRRAKDEALAFLKKLSLEKIAVLPSIGLDFEGAYAFCWINEELVADLSIYGDGTYSYFAKRENTTAAEDEAPLSKPVDRKFIDLLMA